MEKYCGKFDNECRERVRDKYDRLCFICNACEDVDARRLSVHHVDKNRGQGCNEVDWKLVPLCASCHGKAHHEPLMSRIGYLLIHEKDTLVTTYKQFYITREEYNEKKRCTTTVNDVENVTTKDRIVLAISAGMTHIDSISMYADTSVAYGRRLCNELAESGDIIKNKGRVQHTYLPKGDTNE